MAYITRCSARLFDLHRSPSKGIFAASDRFDLHNKWRRVSKTSFFLLPRPFTKNLAKLPRTSVETRAK